MKRSRWARSLRIREVPLGWWFIIVAVACWAIGVPPLVGSLRFLAAAQHATGVIVDVVITDGTGRSTVEYRPIVRYTGADGQLRQFAASETAGERSHFQVGQSVGVLYPPENPGDARLDTWQSRWGLNSTLPALGVLFFVLGLLSVRQSRRGQGPYHDYERCFPISAAQAYAALTTAVTTRFRVGDTDGSAMRIQFNSRAGLLTWGETFVAEVSSTDSGATVRVTGIGNLPTILWQTWRLNTLVQRLFTDIGALSAGGGGSATEDPRGTARAERGSQSDPGRRERRRR